MQRINCSKLGKYDGSGDDIAVVSTGNAWSRSLKIAFASAICLSYRAKSTTGTPDIDIYLEQTHIDPNEVDTGEGVVGDVDNGWAIPAGSSKIADVIDEVWHHVVISPLALPFLRFLCDGQGANPADCTLELVLSKQEDF